MQGMNIESGKRIAQEFFRIGSNTMVLNEDDIKEGKIERRIVGTANIAFACEVAMKVMLYQYATKFGKTHDLQKLYGLLDENLRNGIEALTVAFICARQGKGIPTMSILRISRGLATPLKNCATGMKSLTMARERERGFFSWKASVRLCC